MPQTDPPIQATSSTASQKVLLAKKHETHAEEIIIINNTKPSSAVKVTTTPILGKRDHPPVEDAWAFDFNEYFLKEELRSAGFQTKHNGDDLLPRSQRSNAPEKNKKPAPEEKKHENDPRLLKKRRINNQEKSYVRNNKKISLMSY